VKLAAYPFQKYGILNSVVRPVGADAQEKPEPGNTAGKSVEEAAFRALINLGTGHLSIARAGSFVLRPACRSAPKSISAAAPSWSICCLRFKRP